MELGERPPWRSGPTHERSGTRGSGAGRFDTGSSRHQGSSDSL